MRALAASRWPLRQLRPRPAQVPAHQLPDDLGALVRSGHVAQFVPLITEAHDAVGRVRLFRAAHHVVKASGCICATSRFRLDLHMHMVLALHMHGQVNEESAMTAIQHSQFTVCCNAPSCGATYRSEWDVSRAAVRRMLARRGWTHIRTGCGPKADRDFCPDHKAVAS
jgi:hypothetical protein